MFTDRNEKRGSAKSMIVWKMRMECHLDSITFPPSHHCSLRQLLIEWCSYDSHL